MTKSAAGTIAEWKTYEYPRKVAPLKHFRTVDYQLRTWRGRLNGLIKACRGHDLHKIKRAARRAMWKREPVSEVMADTMEDIDLEKMRVEEVRIRAEAQVEKVKRHLSRKAVAARDKAIREGLKKRVI